MVATGLFQCGHLKNEGDFARLRRLVSLPTQCIACGPLAGPATRYKPTRCVHCAHRSGGHYTNVLKEQSETRPDFDWPGVRGIISAVCF